MSSQLENAFSGDNEALKRRPVQFASELTTKADYEAKINQMRMESAKDAQIISKFISTVCGASLIFYVLFTYEVFKTINTNRYPTIPLTSFKIKTDNAIIFCELGVISLQAASVIVKRDSLGLILKAVIAGLFASGLYAVAVTVGYSFVEAVFWLFPTLALAFSVASQIIIQRNTVTIDKYEQAVMKKFT